MLNREWYLLAFNYLKAIDKGLIDFVLELIAKDYSIINSEGGTLSWKKSTIIVIYTNNY